MAARHASALRRLTASTGLREALRRHPRTPTTSERQLFHVQATDILPRHGQFQRPCDVYRRLYSTATVDAPSSAQTAGPPLLLKLKADLKTAMRTRDAPRLSVVRAALAAVTNLSHTATPVTSDKTLVEAVLLRLERSGIEAAAEFRTAGREDLAEKEEAQLAVVREYVAASGVEVLAGEALREVVSREVAEGGGKQQQQGAVMKRLMRAGGPLDGKVVDKSEVAKIVKELLA